MTFRGKTDCPIAHELDAIRINVNKFSSTAILIDDVRCFLSSDELYKDYPIIDFLVDWAREFGFEWNIQHDIFIMMKK